MNMRLKERQQNVYAVGRLVAIRCSISDAIALAAFAYDEKIDADLWYSNRTRRYTLGRKSWGVAGVFRSSWPCCS